MPNPLVYNEQPRPRVLLYGVRDESVLDGLVPTSKAMPSDGLRSVRSESWDAIFFDVPYSDSIEWAPNHFVLQIGGKPAWPEGNHVYNPALTFVPGEEVLLTGEGPPEFRAALKQVVKHINTLPIPRAVMKRALNERVNYFTPLITDADGNVYAAIYSHVAGPREVIFLPAGLELSREWVALALERWSALDPEAFPAGPEWTQREEWMTKAERGAHEEAVRAEKELESETERLSRQIAQARESLEEARRQADNAERLLLTATDAELVQAVATSLRQFGFDVDDRDSRGARQKFEDLRVTDGDWTAIAEVKGYTAGGSTSDLLKLGRFSREYQRETGDVPAAQWYVVNQFRERDPSTRKQLLWGQDSDVEAFAEADGLVLDTRDLFRLARDHAEGLITANDAKQTLVQARGRFQYPPPPPADEAQSADTPTPGE